MNRAHFLNTMWHHLAVIPEEERKEYMADYEAHFEFGMQNGKTEEDIVFELGDPYELAMELLRERQRSSMTATAEPEYPVYGHASMKEQQARDKRSVRTVFTIIGLVFLNMVMVPLLISAWLAWFSFALAALVCIASPILVGIDALINTFYIAKLSMSSIMVGIGIFLGMGVTAATRGLSSWTKLYIGWNRAVTKGER